MNGGSLETKVDKTGFKLSEREKYIEGKPLMIEVYKSLFMNDNFSSLANIICEIKDGL